MEGLLCLWALPIQEYDFQIEYKKGSQNGNVDALSRCSVGTITHAGQPLGDMQKAQRDDPAISIVYTTFLSKNTPHTYWQTMEDDSSGCVGSSEVSQQQHIFAHDARLFYKMGRGYSTSRSDCK